MIYKFPIVAVISLFDPGSEIVRSAELRTCVCIFPTI